MSEPTIQSRLRDLALGPDDPDAREEDALMRAAADRLDAADGLALAVGLWVHKAWSRDDDAREDVVNALAAYREQPMTRPSDHDDPRSNRRRRLRESRREAGSAVT